MIHVLAGVAIGLVVPWVWRLALAVLHARRDVYLDVHSKERLEMLVRYGDR